MSVIFFGLGITPASGGPTTESGVGSAAGTGTATAVGAVVKEGVGTASALGTATAISEPAYNWPALRMLMIFDRRRRRMNPHVR
jgi:hypothetical protein